MSQSANRRPTGTEIKQSRRERREAQRSLRKRKQAEGLSPASNTSAPNRKCEHSSVEQEREERQDAATAQILAFRAQLPVLLGRLSKIPDFRNPRKLKHKLTVLLLYGILMFVYQMSSRREANKKMTRPMFVENLRIFFPDLESVPHYDTLDRLLRRIDVDEIEKTHLDLIRRLIRKKKFARFLVENHYPVAIDGTQKHVRDSILGEQWLQRKVGKKKADDDGRESQYYVYVLEAKLTFHNGMVIPLMSEFLDCTQGDVENNKQDCETRAFHRLAGRLKREFPRLRIMVLIDGLYANGPIIETCCRHGWQYMIVLQDKSLPSVWREYEELRRRQSGNQTRRTWGDRRQLFQWANDIEYRYGPGQRKQETLHAVVCKESWEEVDQNGKVVAKKSRHVWLSSRRLSVRNVHERCNLAARHRWGIESGILVEKRHGYQYEHCFSHDWNAMRGFHFLMHIGQLFNVLAQWSHALRPTVQKLGLRGCVDFVRETMAGPWLDAVEVRRRLEAPVQLRLA